MAATFLAYWPARRNGFVWDDTALVLRDPLIRSWRLIAESFGHFLFIDATASDFYRPLQRLTFMADYAAWGFQPAGYHLTSIAMHIAAAVALFFLMEKLLAPEKRRDCAVAVALLWAIHPLHTSAVTYVAGRADPLAAVFGFSALLFGLVSLERGRRARWAAVGAVMCFFAALLSKESGVVALMIWFLLLIWRRESWRLIGKWGLAAAAVLVGYGALRLSAEHIPAPRGEPPSLAVRPILAARAVAEYAGLLAAPVTLRMERDVTTRPAGDPAATLRNARWREYQTLLGVVLVTGVVAWWAWARKRVPIASMGLLAALLAYLPVSNLFPLNATVAEHWLYVPSAFLLLAAVTSLHELASGSRLALTAAATCGILWGACLGVRTWQRQADWRDQRTFLTRTIEAGGDTARMRVNLGHLESTEGRDHVAHEQFTLALQRAPEDPFALLGMAAVCVRLGRFEEARTFLAKAERNSVIVAECRQLWAALEFREHGTDTTHFLRQAAEHAPNNWPLRQRYIKALDERGQTAGAVRELRAFLERQAFRADSWRMLSRLLEKQGDREHAAAAAAQAALLDVHLGR